MNLLGAKRKKKKSTFPTWIYCPSVTCAGGMEEEVGTGGLEAVRIGAVVSSAVLSLRVTGDNVLYQHATLSAFLMRGVDIAQLLCDFCSPLWYFTEFYFSEVPQSL